MCWDVTVTKSMSKLYNEHAQCVNFTGAILTINRPGYGKLPTYMMTIGLLLSFFGLGKTGKCFESRSLEVRKKVTPNN